MSSLLFNAFLEQIFRRLKPTWTKNKWGMQLGVTDESRITNLRFADDVFLVAKTKPQLISMLKDVQCASLQCGLELHPDKTKILSNTTRKSGKGKEKTADINGLQVEILPGEKTVKYLGVLFAGRSEQKIELEHTARAAWASFQKYKHELTSKHYDLYDRLRLCDSIVSPAFLYGSSCWTLTRQAEHFIIRTQRRMLRMILGASRRRVETKKVQNEKEPTKQNCVNGGSDSSSSGSDVESDPKDTLDIDKEISAANEYIHDEELEPWSVWIQRVTHTVEDKLRKLNILIAGCKK